MPLMSIAAVAAPIVGGLVKGATKTGKDTTATKSFGASEQYDPNAKYYGGDRNYLNNQSANLNYREGLADTRTANTANYGQAGQYDDLANRWNDQSQQGRQAQGAAANLMYQRATGAVPSIASMQAQRDMQQAQAAQASQAASARGAAGVALAQQGAANNIANAQGAISGQAQINAANERMQAEQGAFNAFSGMRQGDQSSQGMAAQQAAEQANRAQFNAGQEQANRNANDARAMGYEQLNSHMYDTAAQQASADQGRLAQTYEQQQGQHAQQGANNAQWENNNWDKIGDSLSKSGGGGGPVPGKAVGGPVTGGSPYMMGEKGFEQLVQLKKGGGLQSTIVGKQGPELIVPKRPGFVIPHQQTVALAKGGPALNRNGLAGMGARDMSSMLDDRAALPQPRDTRLDDAMAAQVAQDRAPAQPQPRAASPEQQAEFERQLIGAPKEYNSRDPAVGLERIAQERPMLAKGGPRPSNDNAMADERRGVAPGTTDFESTAPKGEKAKASDTIDRVGRIAGGFFGGKRADGGPVDPGMTYLVGEGGAGDSDKAAGSYSGGGGAHNVSPMGMYKAASDAGTAFSRSTGGMADYGREDGGPVAPGDRVRVGEKGPEAVVQAAESRGAAKVHEQQGQELGDSAIHHLLTAAISPGHAIPAIVQGVRAINENRQATPKAAPVEPPKPAGRQMETFQREYPDDAIRAQKAEEENQAAEKLGYAMMSNPYTAGAGLALTGGTAAVRAGHAAIGSFAPEPIRTGADLEREAPAPPPVAAPEAMPVAAGAPMTKQGKLAELFDWLSANGQTSLAKGGR